MKDTKWYIWSNEHKGWWGPNQTGYIDNISMAGIYSFHQACKIVKNANRFVLSKDGPSIPNEAMVQVIE